MEIEYTTSIYKEAGGFVAHARELDVSSMGANVEEAQAHLREAVTLFCEEAATMGTLDEILEEAGYIHAGASWRPPVLISSEPTRLMVLGLRE